LRRRRPKPPKWIKTKPQTDTCPICGRKLYAQTKSRKTVRDYQQTIIETTIYQSCPNTHCPAHLKAIKPGFRIAPPNAKYSKRVIADIIALRRRGLTAREISQRLAEKGLKIEEATIRGIANRYPKIKPAEDYLEKIERLPIPIISIDIAEGTEPDATLLTITEAYSGETIYSGSPEEPKETAMSILKGIVESLDLDAMVWTNSREVYREIVRENYLAPALLIMEPLKPTTVMSIIMSTAVTYLTLIGAFSEDRLERHIRRKYLSLLSDKDLKSLATELGERVRKGKVKNKKALKVLLANALAFDQEELCDPLVFAITLKETYNLALDIADYEKRSKSEDKTPWSIRRTEMAMYYLLYERAKNHDSIKLLRKIMEILEPLPDPWSLSERGRPALFEPKKLLAYAIYGAIHGYRQAEALASHIRDPELDPRTEYAKKNYDEYVYPKKSTLNYILIHKVDEEYLDVALALSYIALLVETPYGELDHLVLSGIPVVSDDRVEDFASLSPALYSVDSTGHETRSYTLGVRSGREVLKRMYVRTFRLVDLRVNGILSEVFAWEKFRYIQVFKRLFKYAPIKPGRMLIDAEFGGEDTLEYLYSSGIPVDVDLGRVVGGEYRLRAKREFSPHRYSRRKLVERVFGNDSARGRVLRGWWTNRRRVALCWDIEHNLKAALVWRELRRISLLIFLPVGRIRARYIFLAICVVFVTFYIYVLSLYANLYSTNEGLGVLFASISVKNRVMILTSLIFWTSSCETHNYADHI